MRTKGYVKSLRQEEIVVGEQYFLGDLYDGDCDLEEILESGSVAPDDNADVIVDFVIEKASVIEPLSTLVKVTDIR